MVSNQAEGRSHSLHVQDALEQAQSALDQSPIRVLRDIRVDNEGESIVLSGHVTSFYQKQLAQELVRSVIPHHELLNSISVDPSHLR